MRRVVDGLSHSDYSFGIIGAPGIGKTSLLHAIDRELTADTHYQSLIPLPIYWDFQNLNHENEFLIDILRRVQLLLTNKPQLTAINRLTFTQDIVQGGKFRGVLKELLDNAFNVSKLSFRPILLLDDLHRGQNIEWLSRALSTLRPIVAHHRELQVVLCGEMPLEREFRNDISPLRNLVTAQITLGVLTVEDVNRLLVIAKELGWEVEDQCEVDLHSMTGGHPYILHYYLSSSLSTYGRINRNTLEKIHYDPLVQSWLANIVKAMHTGESNRMNPSDEDNDKFQLTAFNAPVQPKQQSSANETIGKIIHETGRLHDQGLRAILLALALVLVAGVPFVLIVREVIQLYALIVVVVLVFILVIATILRYQSIQAMSKPEVSPNAATLSHELVVTVYQAGNQTKWVEGAEVRFQSKEPDRRFTNRLGQVKFKYSTFLIQQNQKAIITAQKGRLEGSFGPFALTGQNLPIEIEIKGSTATAGV